MHSASQGAWYSAEILGTGVQSQGGLMWRVTGTADHRFCRPSQSMTNGLGQESRQVSTCHSCVECLVKDLHRSCQPLICRQPFQVCVRFAAAIGCFVGRGTQCLSGRVLQTVQGTIRGGGFTEFQRRLMSNDPCRAICVNLPPKFIRCGCVCTHQYSVAHYCNVPLPTWSAALQPRADTIDPKSYARFCHPLHCCANAA